MTASTVTKLKDINKMGEKKKKSLSSNQKSMKNNRKVKNSTNEEKIDLEKKKSNQKIITKKTGVKKSTGNLKVNKAVKGKGMKKKKKLKLVEQIKENEVGGGINITSSQLNVKRKGQKTKKSLPVSKQIGMKTKSKVRNSTIKVNKAVKGKGMKKKKKEKLVEQINVNEEDEIRITSKRVRQAIEGVRLLTKQKQEEETNKKELLDDEDDFIYLNVSMVKVAGLLEKKNIIRPVRIKAFLPHSLVNNTTDVLLITKDNDKMKDIRDDHTENLNYFQHKLRISGAARHISEVITLRQLKAEYKEYEAKRHLSNRTDVVLCDDTIIRRIPMFLGNKHFYSKKKYPIQVNLKRRNLLAEIERALTVGILLLPMTGNSAIMKIGRLDQTNEMIEENIRAVLKKCKQQFPGGIKNIQSLSLKSSRSQTVPFYVKICSINDIGDIVPKPLTDRIPVTGEVTTAYGNIYTLTPDNEIVFVKRRRERNINAKKRNKIETIPAEKQEEDESLDINANKNVESENLKESEAPKKKKKVSGDLVEDEVPMEKKISGDLVEKVAKKKKVSGDLVEDEVPMKKKILGDLVEKKVPKKKKGSGDIVEDEAPKKKKKKVSEDLVEKKILKKKKVSEDLLKGDIPKKKKVSGKKGKKTQYIDETLEDEKLDQMERDYLKKISMELEAQKVERKKTKKNAQSDDDDSDSDDDWAEISDDDMSLNFNEEL